ncbi:MAG: metallophosphoesterase family protein [Bacteroidota bacterium]
MRIWLFLIFVLPQVGTSLLQAETGRYRLSWRDDPATSMVIGFHWMSGQSPLVLYDTENHGNYAAAYRYRQAPDKTVMAKGNMRTCFVRLRNLDPGTVYHFLVVDSEGQSRPLSFETVPARSDRRLSLISGGDSRNNRAAAQAANKMVSRLRPHAVLFSGDMTAHDAAGEWAAWLDDWQLTISHDGRCYPIVTARGNHEMSNESLVELFDLPSPDNYYALSMGGNLLRVYTLNTLAPTEGTQKSWLEQDLIRSSSATWRIAQYHHAMRPHTIMKPERNDLVKAWAPLFNRHKVQLAIEGDSHVAKITWPISPKRSGQEGFVRDDENGTVYIGEGCWGAPLRTNNDDKPWTRASGSFNQMKWLWIDRNRIEIRTVVVDASRGQAEVDATNRFSVPGGIKLWKPEGDRVISIEKPEPASVAIKPQVPVPSSAGPATSSGTPVAVTNDPPPFRPAAPPPISKVRPDSDWRVKLEFTLPENGPIDIIVIDERMREFFRKKSPVMGAGPYDEWLQLPEIPRGAQFMLVLKAGRQVIGRWELVY